MQFWRTSVTLVGLRVDRPYRRQGRATALLLEAARQAQLKEKETMLLWVDPRNKAAVSLYHKLGFREFGTKYGGERPYGIPAFAVWMRASPEQVLSRDV